MNRDSRRNRMRSPWFVAALLFFLIIPGSLSALEVTIQVFDPVARSPVPDAQLIVKETGEQYFTDGSGKAVIEVPSAGFYTVRAILPDGRLVQPRLQVQAAGQTLTVYTSEPPRKEEPASETQIAGEEGIIVRGRRDKQNLSRYNVRLDEVRRLPGQFGEALRGIESLPGVNAPPFGNGDIVLRGANENANTYLLDDLPLGYPFHLLGLNSVVQNNIIDSIDVYSGSYPVKYGDATGGVISIDTIDSVEKFGGHTTFSIWSASVLFKGPIGEKGKDGYWVAGVRGSYLDQTLKQYIPSGYTLIPRYQDGQFKLRYNLTERQALFFYVLGAKDTFIAAVDNRPTWDPTTEISPSLFGANIALDRVFHTEALRHIWQPNKVFRLKTTLFNHNNLAYTDGNLGIINVKQTLEDGYAALRTEAFMELWKDHALLDVGLEARRFRYVFEGTTVQQTDVLDLNPDLFSTANPDFVTVPVDDRNIASYNSGYAMLTLQGWWLEFKPGVRVDYFGPTKQRVTDPRGTLALKLPTDTTITAGGGIYHRVPDPQQYSPTSGNPRLKLEQAEHAAVGIEQLYGDWIFKVEGFRQVFHDIVVDDPYAKLAFRENPNPYDRLSNPVLVNVPAYYSNDGYGYSEGVEVYIKRSKPPNESGWYGWISYTYSISKRDDNRFRPDPYAPAIQYSADELRILQEYDNSDAIYADFDRRHIINIIFGYKINPEWQIGIKWRYASSKPFTEIIGDDGGLQSNNGRPIFDPIYSTRRNELRLKPYHRLDIRIDRFFNYEWGFGNVFVEALNLYLRDNPGGYSWDEAQPFSKANPSVTPEFGNLVVPSGQGQGLRIPLINFGIEVQF
ncbi:MAG: TonB-dependent receptor plug domain-containing protein [Leptospiraceae bacterium]|nr:TonB-dependent receptor plug domain-containing protein [Leptospiraceae bacterium]